MTKKNTVGAWVAGQKPKAPVLSKEADKPAGGGKSTARKNRVGGRPKVADKRSEKITLSLTKGEAAVLKDKAGMVPHASFLLAKLHEAGVFKGEG